MGTTQRDLRTSACSLSPIFRQSLLHIRHGGFKDLSAIFITPFFAGSFSSAPVTNTGGVLGDLFSPAERATALVVYSMAVGGGPLLAPIVAGAIITSDVRWRWTEYVQTLATYTSKALLIIFLADHWDHDDGRSRGRQSRS
jgi:MFS family permease